MALLSAIGKGGSIEEQGMRCAARGSRSHLRRSLLVRVVRMDIRRAAALQRIRRILVLFLRGFGGCDVNWVRWFLERNA